MLLEAVRLQSNGLNLKYIQQSIDQYVVNILHTCKHAVLYDLNQSTQEWCKLEMEGPLFIVQRSIPPYYQLLLANRKSTDNYVQTITADAIVEVQEQYLFLTEPGMTIVSALWCYELQDNIKMIDTIVQLQFNLKQMPFLDTTTPTPLIIQAPITPPLLPESLSVEISLPQSNSLVTTTNSFDSQQALSTQAKVTCQVQQPKKPLSNPSHSSSRAMKSAAIRNHLKQTILNQVQDQKQHTELSESMFPVELQPPAHIPLPPVGLPRDAYRRYLLTLLKDIDYMEYVYQRYLQAATTTNIQQ